MFLEDTEFKIVSAAQAVFQNMGRGQAINLYKNAFTLELQLFFEPDKIQGAKFEGQQQFPAPINLRYVRRQQNNDIKTSGVIGIVTPDVLITEDNNGAHLVFMQVVAEPRSIRDEEKLSLQNTLRSVFETVQVNVAVQFSGAIINFNQTTGFIETAFV